MIRMNIYLFVGRTGHYGWLVVLHHHVEGAGGLVLVRILGIASHLRSTDGEDGLLAEYVHRVTHDAGDQARQSLAANDGDPSASNDVGRADVPLSRGSGGAIDHGDMVQAAHVDGTGQIGTLVVLHHHVEGAGVQEARIVWIGRSAFHSCCSDRE